MNFLDHRARMLNKLCNYWQSTIQSLFTPLKQISLSFIQHSTKMSSFAIAIIKWDYYHYFNYHYLSYKQDLHLISLLLNYTWPSCRLSFMDWTPNGFRSMFSDNLQKSLYLKTKSSSEPSFHVLSLHTAFLVSLISLTYVTFRL